MANLAPTGGSNAQERSLRSVFVGNIPYEATEDQLKDIFSEVGPVISFRLVQDRDSGKPKGYGFCEYRDQETAMSAMRNLNGFELGSRTLRVDTATSEKSKEELNSLQAAAAEAKEESPYGEPVEPEKAPEAISQAVASLPPEQMFELMKQMKMVIKNNPTEARNMLLQNPQLAYALLQAQVVMRIVDPNVAQAMLHREQNKVPPITSAAPAPEPTPVAAGDGPMQVGGPGGPGGLAPLMQEPPAQQPQQGSGPMSMGPGAAGMMQQPQQQQQIIPGMQQQPPQQQFGAGPRSMMGGGGEPMMGMGRQGMMGGMAPRGGGGMGPRGGMMMGGPGPYQDHGMMQDRGGPGGMGVGGMGPRDPRGDPRVRMRGDPRMGPQPLMAGGPGGPGPSAAAAAIGGPGSQQSSDEEKAALIMQVLQLTDEQIAVLPPDQRQSILILKEQIKAQQTGGAGK